MLTMLWHLAIGTTVLALLVGALAAFLVPEAEKIIRQRTMARVFGDNGFLVGR
jgi:hypothetical protein